jgi:hypothetical protein
MTQEAGARHECRRCNQPITVDGDDPEFGKASHTATGSELGPDGHLAAPIAVTLARAMAAASAEGGS